MSEKTNYPCITRGDYFEIDFSIAGKLGTASFEKLGRPESAPETGGKCRGRFWVRVRALELASRAALNGLQKYDVSTQSPCEACQSLLKCKVRY